LILRLIVLLLVVLLLLVLLLLVLLLLILLLLVLLLLVLLLLILVLVFLLLLLLLLLLLPQREFEVRQGIGATRIEAQTAPQQIGSALRIAAREGVGAGVVQSLGAQVVARGLGSRRDRIRGPPRRSAGAGATPSPTARLNRASSGCSARAASKSARASAKRPAR